jgi:hypothetical protein
MWRRTLDRHRSVDWIRRTTLRAGKLVSVPQRVRFIPPKPILALMPKGLKWAHGLVGLPSG